MKKLLFICMSLFSCSWFLSCSNDYEENILNEDVETLLDGSHYISVEQAKKNAIEFINTFQSKETRGVKKTFEVENVVTCSATDFTSMESRSASSSKPVFYAINFKGENGFVLASTDDRYIPVYAYVENGSFPGTESGNVGYNQFLKNIAMKVTDKNDSSLLVKEQEGVMRNVQIEPLLHVKWDKGSPYNAHSFFTYCSPMGVALAQICSYYLYPTTATYHDNGDSTTFSMNWSSILIECLLNDGKLLTNNTNSDALAHLIHYLEYHYGTETLNNSEQCLSFMYQLGYHVSQLHGLWFSSDVNNVATALGQSKLIYARGYATQNSNLYSDGHAWVIDGYHDDANSGEGYMHCNWGWGGDYNGYFTVDGFTPYSSMHYQYQMAYSIIYY